MTRKAYYQIISLAHAALHEGKIQEAHEHLHRAVPPTSNTCDPEVQKVVNDFITAMERDLPCGHAIGDLCSAPGTVTFCGACRRDLNALRTSALQLQ